jgi:hypothetical protein
MMRTTIDLPEDLHRQAKAIAHARDWTLSEAVAWIMRRGLEERPSEVIEYSPVTGFPQIRIGRVITDEDVKRFLDEDE